VEQSPSESQSVHPVLRPLGPQQLPPRHTPLVHWLEEEHDPPSDFRAFLYSWHSDGLGPSHVTGPPAGCVLHSEEQGRQTQYAFSAQMSLGRLPKYPCGHSLLPATQFPLSSGSVGNRVFTPRHMLHPVAPRMVFAPVQPGGVPFHDTHRSLHFVQMEPGMVASSP
jgi:hypothetical protein